MTDRQWKLLCLAFLIICVVLGLRSPARADENAIHQAPMPTSKPVIIWFLMEAESSSDTHLQNSEAIDDFSTEAGCNSMRDLFNISYAQTYWCGYALYYEDVPVRKDQSI